MTKPTILFLHGLGGSAAAYDSVVELLDPQNFTCIAHTSPGFGSRSDTSVPEHDLVDFYLDDLLEQHVLPDQTTLVAHSIAGVFAMRLVERLPGTSFRLVLLEANLIASDCGMLSRAFANADPSEVDTLRTQCIDQFRHHASAGWRNWADDVALPTPETISSYCRTAVAHSDSGELLNAYLKHAGPKVYVYGDEYLGEPVLDALVSTPVHYVQGASHFLMPDAADKVAEIIRVTSEME